MRNTITLQQCGHTFTYNSIEMVANREKMRETHKKTMQPCSYKLSKRKLLHASSSPICLGFIALLPWQHPFLLCHDG